MPPTVGWREVRLGSAARSQGLRAHNETQASGVDQAAPGAAHGSSSSCRGIPGALPSTQP